MDIRNPTVCKKLVSVSTPGIFLKPLYTIPSSTDLLIEKTPISERDKWGHRRTATIILREFLGLQNILPHTNPSGINHCLSTRNEQENPHLKRGNQCRSHSVLLFI